MTISAKDVAQLREETGAGMMNAKNALEEAGGDMSKAKEILRAKGQAKAAKRAGRSTSEGLVYSYIHATGKLGVLLELQCETDFVARNEQFKELGRQIAMHVAASDPRFVDVASVSADALENTRREYEEEASASGKPADVVAKIVEGKIKLNMIKPLRIVLTCNIMHNLEACAVPTQTKKLIIMFSESYRTREFSR